MPETRASSGAEAVFASTPTAFTQSSTTASSERDSLNSLRSCWYWPTPIDFGIDLDQLGERILQPPRDRHRAAQRHVELGQLLRRIGGGGIDRGPGLRHDDLRHLQIGAGASPARWRACRSRARPCRCRSRSARPCAARELAERRRAPRPSGAAARADRSPLVATTLPVASTTATLTPGAIAGIKAHGRRARRPARRAGGRADWRRTPAPLPPRPRSTAASADRCRDGPGSWCATPSARFR